MSQFNLKDESNSKEFYESRYLDGYMDDWPTEKKLRITEIIKSLNLPETGEALDFGCGNGVFSEVLKKSLPSWKIYGCDISETAILNAAKKLPNCTFFINNDQKYISKKFDFVFTHHVLEHVFDIKKSAEQINQRLKEKSSMLHIFPCGNPGSYEFKLCNLRLDGIDVNKENRFFYEDEGHLRRLTTVQCEKLFKEFGFDLKQEYYSHQYFGAIDWITKSNRSFIIKMFDPRKGKNLKAKIILTGMLIKMLLISTLRIIPIIYKRLKQKDKLQNKNPLILLLFNLSYKLLNPIDNYFTKKSDEEWNQFKQQKNGSEMYLYFTR